MSDLIYTNGKLGKAVSILATHPGRINERLTEAANRALVAVDPAVFNASAPGIYIAAPRYWQMIWSAITAVRHDPKGGVFAPSIDRLSEIEASEIARMIVSLSAMLDAIERRVESRP